MNEEEIFRNAAALSSEQRAAYVAAACVGQPDLQQRIEQLLASHEDGSFMQRAADCWTIDRGPGCAPSWWEQPGERIGHYQLVAKIGEGGFGTVWRAEQLEPVHRRVALKIIKLGMDTRSVIARFEQERRALALMEHPHIARVLDAGATPQGRPFFVMELVEGERITQFCQERDLCTADRLRLFIAVCQAVQHAHQKGIIHRDLKPSNILVTLQDGTPVPKVIDFGIAKATTGQRLADETLVTACEQSLGTPAYMSPEQADRSETDIDTRSDIYSLGVLLYELLTGATPFDAQQLLDAGLHEMRRIIREQEPVRPSTRVSTLNRSPLDGGPELATPRSPLPTDLDWIVLKCLEKDRTRRYETVNGLATDLRRFLNDEPVVACPPTAAYRLKKFVRRNTIAVTGALLTLFLLLAGVAGTSLGLIRAADNAAKLEASLDRNRVALAHGELSRDPPNILQAEKLLDSCNPRTRQWEWHHLKRRWLDEPFVLQTPGEPGLNSISFSSDDRSIAAAGSDGSITVWDVATRQMRLHFPAHTNGFTYCVAFDPTDSTKLVSAGSDNNIRLWDLGTTNAIYSWPSRFSFQWGMAYAVAFSPDGQQIAGPTENGVVTVWSATTGAEVWRLLGNETIYCTAFSPDGRLLAVGGVYGFIHLWDIRDGKRRWSMGTRSPPVASLAFSNRDGQRLAAAGFDNAVTVWDLASQRELLRFDVDTKQASGVVFSPDNRRLATAGFDRTVKLWDARTGQEVLTFRDFAGDVQCVAFSTNGRYLAACGLDGTVRLWDGAPRSPADEKRALVTMQQPAAIVGTMSLHPEGRWLASAGGTLASGSDLRAPVFVWNTVSGHNIQTFEGHEVYVFQVAFSPNGRFLASTGDDIGDGYIAWLWDAATGQRSFSTEPYEGEGVLFCLAYSPAGQQLLAGSQDGRILVWNAVTGRRIGVLGEPSAAVFNLSFSPDGRHLASATETGVVHVWDGTLLDESQTNAFEITTVVGDLTDTLAFTPDSKRLVVATDDQVATIWDIESRAKLDSLRTRTAHGIRALAVSPDGRWIASGGMDSKVNLWDVQTATVRETLRGHKGEVTRLVFVNHPEGLRLISGGRDGAVKVWDMGLPEER